MRTYEKVSISLPKSITAEARKRGGSLSNVVSDALQKHWDMLNRAAIRLAERRYFTDAQMACLVDAFDPQHYPTWQGEAARLSDDFEHAWLTRRLGKRHRVDGQALLTKISALDELERTAVIEGIRRWWLDFSRNGNAVSLPCTLKEMSA